MSKNHLPSSSHQPTSTHKNHGFFPRCWNSSAGAQGFLGPSRPICCATSPRTKSASRALRRYKPRPCGHSNATAALNEQPGEGLGDGMGMGWGWDGDNPEIIQICRILDDHPVGFGSDFGGLDEWSDPTKGCWMFWHGEVASEDDWESSYPTAIERTKTWQNMAKPITESATESTILSRSYRSYPLDILDIFGG